MPENETFPNFVSHPDSPSVKDKGVQIAVSPGPHPADKPVVLRGVYKADADMIAKSQGAPLSWVILIVFRRDQPDLWTAPAQDVSQMAPIPPRQGPAPDPSYREGGSFNFDLARMGKRLAPGGRYWIMAAFGDHVSDRIEFQMKPTQSS